MTGEQLEAGGDLRAGDPVGVDRAGRVVPIGRRAGDLVFWDRHGCQLPSVLVWARLLQSDDYRQVGLDLLVSPTRRILVSTIWRGLDPLWSIRGGAPLIFETLVRGGRGWRDGITVPWPNEATALRGHRLLCEAMRLDWSRRRLERELASLSWGP